MNERVILGAIMSLSFVMTHAILSAIQSGSAALQTRYQMLFEGSPTAVLEEDWSEAVEYVRSEYTGKPDRIKQFLMAYPEVVKRAVSRIKVLRVNEAAVRLLEIDNPARFLGYRDSSELTEESIEGWVAGLVALYEGATSWEMEIRHRRRSGEQQWLQTRMVDSSTAIPASSLVIAFADITHIKARNEAMAEMIRAKDEFIANISHELRTPLTAVIGLTSEIAATPDMDDAERDELLALVACQAAEMSNIVADLLVAARAEMGTVSVELTNVDLIEEVQATADGLGMSVELPKEPTPEVVADPRRVRQILRNLLTNALRYGGPSRRISTGALRDRVWLEVRDNGVGIPDEDAAHIFEPYVTGNSGVHGSVGLGLAVARQLAELMGGSLAYERSAGDTVFRLVLPMAGARHPVMASHTGDE